MRETSGLFKLNMQTCFFRFSTERLYHTHMMHFYFVVVFCCLLTEEHRRGFNSSPESFSWDGAPETKKKRVLSDIVAKVNHEFDGAL